MELEGGDGVGGGGGGGGTESGGEDGALVGEDVPAVGGEKLQKFAYF